VAPDFEAYQAGRREGLRQYCQPSRGFNVGAGGGRYNGVCPSDLEPDFVDAFNSGHKLYNLRSQVNSANYQINSREKELDNTKDRIRKVEADLISSETTNEERVLLLVDLKELSERIGEIEAEIVDLVEERAIYEQQLAQYEAMIADTNY
jgi:peptidoglycan hydrolase CwlO-like protein